MAHVVNALQITGVPCLHLSLPHLPNFLHVTRVNKWRPAGINTFLQRSVQENTALWRLKKEYDETLAFVPSPTILTAQTGNRCLQRASANLHLHNRFAILPLFSSFTSVPIYRASVLQNLTLEMPCDCDHRGSVCIQYPQSLDHVPNTDTPIYFQYLFRVRDIAEQFAQSCSNFYFPLLLSAPSYTQNAIISATKCINLSNPVREWNHLPRLQH